MKYLRQFMIILAVSFLGELLKYFLPLPIPASIYGMVLMFLALQTGILPLKMVKETADYLIEIMPLMFIPAGVGLIESWDVLKPVLVPIAIIVVLSTVIVMAVSGRVTQAVIRRARKKAAKEES